MIGAETARGCFFNPGDGLINGEIAAHLFLAYEVGLVRPGEGATE